LNVRLQSTYSQTLTACPQQLCRYHTAQINCASHTLLIVCTVIKERGNSTMTFSTHFSLYATSTCCMSSITSEIQDIISRWMSHDVTERASNILSTNSCQRQ